MERNLYLCQRHARMEYDLIMKSELADYPGELVLSTWNVGARREYRRAYNIGLPTTNSNGHDLDAFINLLEKRDDIHKRLFWGALAIMDREQTTIQYLLDLAPGCDVDGTNPDLFDWVATAVALHVTPKKTQSRPPEMSAIG